MAKVFLWKNLKTGETVEHSHPSSPPTDLGVWKRVFHFGVGKVKGAGDSPARPSP